MQRCLLYYFFPLLPFIFFTIQFMHFSFYSIHNIKIFIASGKERNFFCAAQLGFATFFLQIICFLLSSLIYLNCSNCSDVSPSDITYSSKLIKIKIKIKINFRALLSFVGYLTALPKRITVNQMLKNTTYGNMHFPKNSQYSFTLWICTYRVLFFGENRIVKVKVVIKLWYLFFLGGGGFIVDCQSVNRTAYFYT